MAEVFHRRLSRWQAEDKRSKLAELYVDAYRDRTDAGAPDPAAFLERFADHLQQPEFDMIVANDPALVGCAYGFRITREGNWLDRFAGIPRELEELVEVTGARQLFVVAELMVLPAYRRRGVGGRLLDQLLTRIGVPVAVVLIDPGDTETQGAFSAWGWTKAGVMAPRGEAKPQEAWCLRREA
ncbi:GNAT family N-acetyltransferase [Streptomyces lonarensis]|uniref:GNAT family N-acetyltransferase n=1 Tax=Streptomyces lonarensis TaxID=700599 RepID=A0A7X6D3U1_9ACTN|nr:GNAT family N-acetyltransferase [Streptomyces lonarensis]NJQ07683.1 GNAT family N-acetyltransferase [Streptomyces lonarensis]